MHIKVVSIYNSSLFVIFRYADSPLPSDLHGQASVAFGDSFLLAGGECVAKCRAAKYLEEILEWLPEEETFVTRDERLETGRNFFGAVMVDDTIVDCT